MGARRRGLQWETRPNFLNRGLFLWAWFTLFRTQDLKVLSRGIFDITVIIELDFFFWKGCKYTHTDTANQMPFWRLNFCPEKTPFFKTLNSEIATIPGLRLKILRTIPCSAAHTHVGHITEGPPERAAGNTQIDGHSSQTRKLVRNVNRGFVWGG